MKERRNRGENGVKGVNDGLGKMKGKEKRKEQGGKKERN
jgi:hypothetical protein